MLCTGGLHVLSRGPRGKQRASNGGAIHHTKADSASTAFWSTGADFDCPPLFVSEAISMLARCMCSSDALPFGRYSRDAIIDGMLHCLEDAV